MGFFPFTPVAAPPSGAAGGILGGTYPNPSFGAGAAVGGILTGTLPNPTSSAAASAAFAPANPATTVSLTQVMMGFGFTGVAVSYTPAKSGIVEVLVSGLTGTNTGLAAVQLGPRFGIGAPAAAPQNGAAVSGTAFPVADFSMRGSGTGSGGGFTFAGRLALVAGTQYWFDLAVQTGNGADAAFVTNMMFFFAELNN